METDIYRSKAESILTLFWDNFISSERAFIMRDVIAIELEKVADEASLKTFQALVGAA